MQQGLSARLPVAMVEMSNSQLISLPNYHACKSTYSPDIDFGLSDLNLEDDENVKSKPVYTDNLCLFYADIRFIAEADQLKCKSSFRSTFSCDLFILNRVLRL
jgi:hypothetical protein